VIPAVLALEDGTIFKGISIGFESSTTGEVVFNTSPTGYQEIITDPSYCKQIVTLTYPHIGNVGVNPDDDESSDPHVSGLIIKELSPIASNYRAVESLDVFLKRKKIVGIAGIDTRKLTRIIREKGAQRGSIITNTSDANEALELTKDIPPLKGLDLAQVVSTKESYAWENAEIVEFTELTDSKPGDGKHVVVMDYGVKRNILNILVSLGLKITVVNAKTDYEEVMRLSPDGIFLSNGPGDPEPCDYAIKLIRSALDHNVPIFGICLGHQLLGISAGAKTEKMKFGHHGANHPVIDLKSKQVFITSQNHGFAISEDSDFSNIEVTHRSLFDNSIQGIKVKDKPAYSFQGHPEASPGPHDIKNIFIKFIKYIKNNSLSS
jgi:carbamoyl-phosphate synthase small subunit